MIEIGICQNTQSQFNSQRKLHNDSCKFWLRYSDRRTLTKYLNHSNMICLTCEFWKKVSEMKQSKLVIK